MNVVEVRRGEAMWIFVDDPRYAELLDAGWEEICRKPTYVEDWTALLVRAEPESLEAGS